MQKNELADNNYEMVLDLNPKIAEAYYKRGNIRFQSGDNSGACSDWNKALNLKYRKADENLRKYCDN